MLNDQDWKKEGSIAETTIDEGYLLIIVAYSSPVELNSTPSGSKAEATNN
jgi:hypothetical protein